MLKKNAVVLSLLAVVAWGTVGCGNAEDSASQAQGGQAAATGGDLWCKEHGVEEKYCVICHPEIREESDLLLCPEHGDIPEAICTACHPELKDKYETCPHELPPAFCQTCAANTGGEGAETHDHEHDHQHNGEKQS